MFASISSLIFRAITPTSIAKKKKKKESSTSNNNNNSNRNSDNDNIYNNTETETNTSTSTSTMATKGRTRKQYPGGGDGGISNALAKRFSHISGFSSSDEGDDDEDDHHNTVTSLKATTNSTKRANNKNEDEIEDAKPIASLRPPPVAAVDDEDKNKTSEIALWKILDQELRLNIGACVSCGICKSTMKEPVRTPCVHSFCKACIQTWLEYNHKKCPMCNTHLSSKRSLSDLPEYLEELGDKYKMLLVEFGLAPGTFIPEFTLTQQVPAVGDDDDENNTKERCFERYAVSKTWQSKALPIINPSKIQITENNQVVEANLNAYKDAVRRNRSQNRANQSIIMEEKNDEKNEEEFPMSGGDDTTMFATPAETESQRELLSLTADDQHKKPNAAAAASTATESSSRTDKKQQQQLKKPPNLPLAPENLNRVRSSAKKNSCTTLVEEEQKGQENESSSCVAKKPPPPRKHTGAASATTAVADPKDKDIEEEKSNTKLKARGGSRNFSAIEKKETPSTPVTTKGHSEEEETDPFDTGVSPIAKQSSQTTTMIQTPPSPTQEEGKSKDDTAIHNPIEDITGLCEDAMGALHWTNRDNSASHNHGLYQGTQDEEDDDERSKSLLEASSLLEDSPEKRSSSQHQVDSPEQLSRSQNQDNLSSEEKPHVSQREETPTEETPPRATTTKDHSPNKMMGNVRLPKKSVQPPCHNDDAKAVEAEFLSPTTTKAKDPSNSMLENQHQSEQYSRGRGFRTGANDEDKGKEAATELRSTKNYIKSHDLSSTKVDNHQENQDDQGDNHEQRNSLQVGEDTHLSSSSGGTAMANNGIKNNDEDDDDMMLSIQDSLEPKGSGDFATVNEVEKKKDEGPKKSPSSSQDATGRRGSRQKHRSRSREKKCNDGNNEVPLGNSFESTNKTENAPEPSDASSSPTSNRKDGDLTPPARISNGIDNACYIDDDTMPPKYAAPSSSSLNMAEEAPKENPTPKANNLHADRASFETKTAEQEQPTVEPRQRRSRSSSRTRTATAAKPTVNNIENHSPGRSTAALRSEIQDVARKPISKRRLSGKTYSRRKPSSSPMDARDDDFQFRHAEEASISMAAKNPTLNSEEKSTLRKRNENAAENTSAGLDVSENQDELAQDRKVGESHSEPVKNATTTRDSQSVTKQSDALMLPNERKKDCQKDCFQTKESNEELDEADKKPAAKKASSRTTSAARRAKNTASRCGDATSIPADATHRSEGAQEPHSKPATAANCRAAASIPTNPLREEGIPASADNSTNTDWAVGIVVNVKSRMWPGVNKPGGVAKIVGINADKTYNVQYILGGRESNLDGIFLSPNQEPAKRRRADEDLPLDLLKSLAAAGFDTTGAGVGVPVAAKRAVKEAEKSKTSQKQQRRQKAAMKSAKKEPSSNAARTTASNTLQDNTNRKRDRPIGTEKKRIKKTKSAPTAKPNETTDKLENGSRTLKRKGNTAQNKNKKAKATCRQNEKLEIPDLPNEEASKLADERYQAQFQAAIERGVVQVLASKLEPNEINTLKSMSKVAGKDVELKVVQTFNKNTNVCVMPNDPGCPKAGLRTVKSLSCALAGIPITSPAWFQECRTNKKVIFPSSVVRTFTTKNSLLEQKNCNVSGVARLAANVHKYGKSALPLTGHGIYLCGDYKPEHRNDLSKLAKEAGAKLLLQPADVSDKLQLKAGAGGGTGPTTIVLVCRDDPKGKLISSKIEKEIKLVVEQQPNKQTVMVVDSSWIIESITCGKALEADAFPLTNPKAKELWQLILDKKKATDDSS